MSKLVEELRKYVELKRSSTMRVTRTEAVELLAHIERLEAKVKRFEQAGIRWYKEQVEETFDQWVEDDATHWLCDKDAAWQAWMYVHQEKVYPMMKRIERLEAALAAIKARLNGEFDHPALEKLGALGEFRDDVERIIEQMNQPEREAQSEESSARSAQALLADVREGGSPLTEVLVDVARYWHTGSYKIARDELYATINHFSHDILQITETKLASKARSSADLNEVSHDQQF